VTFERAASIADAVLLEGYVLYPYRATSAKNQYRWTFGVLAPRSWSEAGGCEASWLEAQLLVCGENPVLRGRLRFLAVVLRQVEQVEPGSNGERFRAVETLDFEGRSFITWEEGEVCELDFDALAEGTVPFVVAAQERVELLHDAAGEVRGRIVRTRAELHATVGVSFEALETPPAERQIWRVAIRVDNVTPGPSPQATRAQVMIHSFVSAHLLVAGEEDACFLSLLDPPPHARDLAAACKSVRCWPVLAGHAGEGHDDIVLASPIILYDHPQIAPESTGDFCDGCEIDEILALRTRTLTDAEKIIARATDARAAAIVDRVDAMTDAELARLHGARRDRPSILPGARVRLRLDGRKRRTDAQDVLYSGRSATVHAVRKDVDGTDYLAVTIDDDPAAEMHALKGRFHYYTPDEVELLDPAAARTA
jgi:hypothetical protein